MISVTEKYTENANQNAMVCSRSIPRPRGTGNTPVSMPRAIVAIPMATKISKNAVIKSDLPRPMLSVLGMYARPVFTRQTATDTSAAVAAKIIVVSAMADIPIMS
ncbi:MAG: hypothetical protein E6Q88_11570 [Lysobacteraceae bacterium]|nr:MAG: hypothetical protein E6Q88_11570 [Xanthomonadaceae bacterium]